MTILNERGRFQQSWCLRTFRIRKHEINCKGLLLEVLMNFHEHLHLILTGTVFSKLLYRIYSNTIPIKTVYSKIVSSKCFWILNLFRIKQYSLTPFPKTLNIIFETWMPENCWNLWNFMAPYSSHEISCIFKGGTENPKNGVSWDDSCMEIELFRFELCWWM